MTQTAVTQHSIVSGDQENDEEYGKIVPYLTQNSAEFRRLADLRREGWNRPEGDHHFTRQRRRADFAGEKTKRHFFRMMRDIGMDMQTSTGALKPRQQEGLSVLDTCMAPGGFLSVVVDLNPHSVVLALSLPRSSGGHEVLMQRNSNTTIKFLDITMLAEDMGVAEIPDDHPDAGNFLPRLIPKGETFDLVLCDGQVLRTHDRHQYREHCEARRLIVTQLALGLGHLRPGGTMVVLLHKVEAWETIRLLRIFCKFSSVCLYKSSKFHAIRSSFYMIASDIQNEHPEAIRSLREWEVIWNVATFGTEEEYASLNHRNRTEVQEVLQDFGPKLISLAVEVWTTQANALANAAFMKVDSKVRS